MTRYVWRVRAKLPERFGQLCRVLVRGKLNSCLVEFGDGYRVVTSRNYVRRRAPAAARVNIRVEPTQRGWLK